MANPIRMFQLHEEDLELLRSALDALEEVFDADDLHACKELGIPKPHHDAERERITILRRRFA